MYMPAVFDIHLMQIIIINAFSSHDVDSMTNSKFMDVKSNGKTVWYLSKSATFITCSFW